jgi:hypothetical protein
MAHLLVTFSLTAFIGLMGIIIVVIYFKKMAAKSVTNQDFKET